LGIKGFDFAQRPNLITFAQISPQFDPNMINFATYFNTKAHDIRLKKIGKENIKAQVENSYKKVFFQSLDFL